VFKGVKDSSGDYANMKAMIDAFASRGFEVYSGSDEYVQKILAEGGAGCITAASNCNSHWGGIVYREAHRPGGGRRPGHADRHPQGRHLGAADPQPARGDRPLHRGCGWRTIRPPHLPLDAAAADKAWATWEATGAIPLPGLGQKQAPSERRPLPLPPAGRSRPPRWMTTSCASSAGISSRAPRRASTATAGCTSWCR
jgi:4-hydroxy-tetrahydrodipicolinate synthase